MTGTGKTNTQLPVLPERKDFSAGNKPWQKMMEAPEKSIVSQLNAKIITILTKITKNCF